MLIYLVIFTLYQERTTKVILSIVYCFEPPSNESGAASRVAVSWIQQRNAEVCEKDTHSHHSARCLWSPRQQDINRVSLCLTRTHSVAILHCAKTSTGKNEFFSPLNLTQIFFFVWKRKPHGMYVMSLTDM